MNKASSGFKRQKRYDKDHDQTEKHKRIDALFGRQGSKISLVPEFASVLQGDHITANAMLCRIS